MYCWSRLLAKNGGSVNIPEAPVFLVGRSGDDDVPH